MAHFLKYPSHPGELIREDVLPHYNLNVTDVAKLLKAARPNLSNVLNGKAAVSAEMAMKFEVAFGVSAQLLLRMQSAYDFAVAQERRDEIVEGIQRAEPVLV